MNKTASNQTTGSVPGSGSKVKRRFVWTAGIIIGVYTLSLCVPIISSYTKFPLYVIKCGKVPIAATDFAAASSYDTLGSKYYSLFFVNRYFCSEVEAQEAGYHRNPLNY